MSERFLSFYRHPVQVFASQSQKYLERYSGAPSKKFIWYPKEYSRVSSEETLEYPCSDGSPEYPCRVTENVRVP